MLHIDLGGREREREEGRREGERERKGGRGEREREGEREGGRDGRGRERNTNMSPHRECLPEHKFTLIFTHSSQLTCIQCYQHFNVINIAPMPKSDVKTTGHATKRYNRPTRPILPYLATMSIYLFVGFYGKEILESCM